MRVTRRRSVRQPAIRPPCYRPGEVELACTIPPRLTVYFTRHGQASAEAYQAVLANHADHPTVRTVVGLFQMADGMIARVRWGDRRCTALAIELGLPPSLRLIFEPPVQAP